VERSDGSVDFHAVTSNLSVNEGDVLARRRPPVPGTPGVDVLGAAIPVTPAVDRLLGPMAGKGTEVKGDELVAVRAGRPVFSGTKVEVLPVFDVKGDVNYAVGNIRFNGDVTISGDVHPGFTIEAEGSVTIRGIVEPLFYLRGQGRDRWRGGWRRELLDSGGRRPAGAVHPQDARHGRRGTDR
jgi:uncharacterized protein (DUF342 family)